MKRINEEQEIKDRIKIAIQCAKEITDEELDELGVDRETFRKMMIDIAKPGKNLILIEW